ncbi:MAG: GNAT family N-acetyltransferase [Altererythrobacter sp.]|nr:GNAT family N-acetyltransferase [Altererythrobacter sp.]
MPHILRPFRSDDAARLSEIFAEAVRVVGAYGYSAEQVRAWAARSPAAEARILERLSAGDWIMVAVGADDQPVAYALLERDGHLDHLYCHPDHTRQGLADLLLESAEEQARRLGCKRLYTEASELARPAFERAGYSVTHRRDFSIEQAGQDVPIHNYGMEKALA